MALSPSTGWQKYAELSINNPSNDYQMRLEIRRGSSQNNDPQQGIIYDDNNCYYDDLRDVRIGTSDDPTVAEQLPMWAEEVQAGIKRVLWIKTNGNALLYLFVGNENADEYSDGENTFIFFDDFNDGSFDTSKWNAYHGAPAEEDGYLKLIYGKVKSNDTFSYNTKIRCKWKRVAGNQYGLVGVGYSSHVDDTNALYTNQYTRTDYQTYIRYTSESNSNLTTHNTNIEIDTNWHVSDIERLETSCRYRTDGGEEYTETTNIPTVALPVKFFCRQSGDEMWVDWVFVGKYSSSPSTWSNFGAWQNVGGIQNINVLEGATGVDEIATDRLLFLLESGAGIDEIARSIELLVEELAAGIDEIMKEGSITISEVGDITEIIYIPGIVDKLSNIDVKPARVVTTHFPAVAGLPSDKKIRIYAKAVSGQEKEIILEALT